MIHEGKKMLKIEKFKSIMSSEYFFKKLQKRVRSTACGAWAYNSALELRIQGKGKMRSVGVEASLRREDVCALVAGSRCAAEINTALQSRRPPKKNLKTNRPQSAHTHTYMLTDIRQATRTKSMWLTAAYQSTGGWRLLRDHLPSCVLSELSQSGWEGAREQGRGGAGWWAGARGGPGTAHVRDQPQLVPLVRKAAVRRVPGTHMTCTTHGGLHGSVPPASPLPLRPLLLLPPYCPVLAAPAFLPSLLNTT